MEFNFSKITNLQLAILPKILPKKPSQVTFMNSDKNFCNIYFRNTFQWLLLLLNWLLLLLHTAYVLFSCFFYIFFTCFFQMLLHFTCLFYTFISIFRLRCEEILSICEAYYPSLTWTFGEHFLQSFEIF